VYAQAQVVHALSCVVPNREVETVRGTVSKGTVSKGAVSGGAVSAAPSSGVTDVLLFSLVLAEDSGVVDD
jgi:hypothetical protein